VFDRNSEGDGIASSEIVSGSTLLGRSTECNWWGYMRAHLVMAGKRQSI
jgi:hypothetical protein